MSRIAQPLRFTARERDAESGLVFMRARYYDPQLARFLSEDPIGLAGGINPYAYVGNDPVNQRDPLGLASCPPGTQLQPEPYDSNGDGKADGVVYVCKSGGSSTGYTIPGITAVGQTGGWFASWGTVLSMFGQWATNTGPEMWAFGGGSPQVAHLQNSPGANSARQIVCSKYAAGNSNPHATGVRFQFVTLRHPIRSAQRFWNAGLNSTRQFVGSYTTNVFGNGDGTATFYVTNPTSMKSFLYGIGPAYDRAGLTGMIPGANMHQVYSWTESLAATCQ